ncbi:MAG: SDR family oxidoreductase [Ignavibacteria bacterium]|nr:SDR family oxidoreductase [Ignavibacteria bacterium]
MKINLQGRNAVVCGSTQGIGKAIAVEFAKAGASLTLVSRNEESLKKVINELDGSSRQRHSYICADFTDPDNLRTKLEEYVKSNPPVHILVNNTGGPKSGEILNATTTEFETAFRQHLICNHILVQTFAGGMKKEKYGRIINIISTSVKQPIRNLGVSNTIRAAVANWAKTLSAELAPFGITVNNILPGATKTERLYSLFKSRAEASGKSVEEIEKEWLSEIPCGRFAEPVELAFAVLFLASEYASYINGINLPVDGGRLNTL